MIAREECGMRWLVNGVLCVPDVFGVESPIKCKALFIRNLIAQLIISIYVDDKGS